MLEEIRRSQGSHAANAPILDTVLVADRLVWEEELDALLVICQVYFLPFVVEGVCQRSDFRMVSYLSHVESDIRKLRTISKTMRIKGSKTGTKGLGQTTKINTTQCTQDDSDRNPRPLNGQRRTPQRAMT